MQYINVTFYPPMKQGQFYYRHRHRDHSPSITIIVTIIVIRISVNYYCFVNLLDFHYAKRSVILLYRRIATSIPERNCS